MARARVFAVTVPVALYKCGVCLLVGTDEARLRKAFAEAVDGYLRDGEEADAFFDDFLAKRREAGDGCEGLCVSAANGLDFIVWIPRMSVRTLVHEIVHAADFILGDRGVVGTEARAYLVEYLYAEMTGRR